MKNSAPYLSTDPEVLFQWFLEEVPNLQDAELPTLRAGCVFLAKFNEINEMDLDLTKKDRATDRLNPILRHQKACFDSWMIVARRFGLTTLDRPGKPDKTNDTPSLKYDLRTGKPLEPTVPLRGGPDAYKSQMKAFREAFEKWEKENTN